ncbi:MAG: hypothetical protein EP338_02345 [Bacteroidetes bacterium]|nr:MAG: hypothetical protein EP338_02345 [Bacteroidota bacterium]
MQSSETMNDQNGNSMSTSCFEKEFHALLHFFFDEKSGDEFPNLRSEKLLPLLQEHRLSSFYTSQALAKGHSIDSPILDEAASEQNRLFLQFAELGRIGLLFQEAEIDFIPLKGPFLSHRISGNYYIRNSQDLDLLIHDLDLPEVIEILQKQHYQSELQLPKTQKQLAALLRSKHHLTFYENDTDTRIEIHWRLLAPNYMDRWDNEHIWSRSSIENHGKLKIRTLSKIDEILYLCIHGTRHHWGRLFWLNDLRLLLQQMKPEDYQKLEKAAQEFDLTKYLENSRSLIKNLSEGDFENIPNETREIWQALEKGNNTAFQSSQKGFRSGNYIRHYRMVLKYEGWRGVWRENKQRRTKPENWNYFVFPDRYFCFNQYFSRIIWLLRRMLPQRS